MDVSVIPSEMKALKQYVVWRSEMRVNKDGEERLTKVPYQANNISEYASTKNPDTWSDLDDAVTAFSENSGQIDGIGFVFQKENGIVGVDLDKCLCDGELNDFARPIVRQLNSFTEISPSGNGVHVYVKGNISGDGINTKPIEIYDTGRFFTWTGQVYKGMATVREGGSFLRELYSRWQTKSSVSNVVSLHDIDANNASSDVVDRFLSEHYCKALWEKRIPHKSQSEYDLAIASCATHRGFTPADCAALIAHHRMFYREKPEKAYRQDYLQDTISKAQSESSGSRVLELQKQYKQKPFLLDIHDILANPQPLRWLIKRYIPSTGLFWLSGRWSSKKTFLAINISIHVAHGLAWCGNRVTQTNVLYLCGEGEYGIGRRVAALKAATGMKIDKARFKITSCPVLLNDKTEVANLHYWIQELDFKFGLMVIDTKSANMAGSDSDPAEMNNWINLARKLERQYECAILIIDHTGHGEEERMRGASQQPAAADGAYFLKCDQDNDKIIEFTTQKDPKDAPAPPNLRFRAEVVELPDAYGDEDGDFKTSIHLVQQHMTSTEEAEQKKAAGLGGKAEKALAILRTMYAECKKNISIAGDPNRTPRVDRQEWRQKCLDAGLKVSTFSTIPDALERRDLIGFGDGGRHVYLKEV